MLGGKSNIVSPITAPCPLICIPYIIFLSINFILQTDSYIKSFSYIYYWSLEPESQLLSVTSNDEDSLPQTRILFLQDLLSRSLIGA